MKSILGHSNKMVIVCILILMKQQRRLTKEIEKVKSPIFHNQ
jgi:hypothetical protein